MASHIRNTTLITPTLIVSVLVHTFNFLSVSDVLQISARIPFKFDIAFLSGTGSDRSNVKERVSSLTGAFIWVFSFVLV